MLLSTIPIISTFKPWMDSWVPKQRRLARPTGMDETRIRSSLSTMSPACGQLAARILYEEGFQVHEAVDGRDALDFIERGRIPLDAVVSDIVMPRLNGVQLLKSLAVSHPDLPVILMSGYGADELAQREISSPCSVLGKPFSPEHLISEVRRCIGQRG